ncbi:MAG: hypothetical protein ABIH28_03870 [archaeon]
MKQKRGGFFFKAFLIVMGILILSVAFFLYDSGALKFNKGLTGFIAEEAIDYLTKMNPNTKLFLIVQWVVLILVLIFLYIKDIKNLKKHDKKGTILFKKQTGESKTDLDSLYATLQENKFIKISTIVKSFKVSKEVAMEWCKILESADLATVEYPNLGGPILKINK